VDVIAIYSTMHAPASGERDKAARKSVKRR
jgi:hypothetical protein